MIIWNIDNVIELLSYHPQTHKSLMKNFYSHSSTAFVILNRKINSKILDGRICSTIINGDRKGEKLYYLYPKNYQFIIVADRIKNKIYSFQEHVDEHKLFIRLINPYEYKVTHWEPTNKEIKIMKGEILKWL